MSVTKGLLWSQGMFLQPQHFQYLETHQASTTLALMTLSRPYCWGVVDVALDTDALQAGVLCFHRLVILFPDGTLASFPDNAILPSRNLDVVWQDRRAALQVHVGIRCKSAAEKEVSTVASVADAESVTTRKVVVGEGVEATDLHSDGTPVRLRLTDYALKLAFGDERDASPDHVWMTVATLVAEGRQTRPCDVFVPPCVTIGASPVLSQLLITLKHTLVSRGRVLESFKTSMTAEQAGMSAMALTNRLALSTVARYLPMLAQLVEAQKVHPWEAYGVVRQLASELSTFSSRMDLEGGDSTTSGHTYRHEALGMCFKALIDQVGQVLAELTSGPEMMVSMKRESPVKFTAGLGRDFLDRKHALYLVLKTRENPRQWMDNFLAHAKLGALGQVDVYARRALPGVSVMTLQGKPIGVTGQPNASYLMIERDSHEWGYVHDSGYLGIIWNDAPEDFSVDVVVVRQ